MSDTDHSEISFKQLFDNANDAAILIIDEDGTIISSNGGVERSYGYAEKELKGENISVLYTPEDNQKNKANIELTNCLQKGFANDKNFIVHKDGSYIWTHGETILTQDQYGKIRLVKLIYDINDQKLLEVSLLEANKKLIHKKDQILKMNEELTDTNERLKKLNKDLDTFVYTASHDLKGPINNIEALVTLINEEMNKESREKVSKEMELLMRSLDKFKSVIYELSRTAREKSVTEETQIPFTEILEEVKMSLREDIERTNTVFSEDYSKAPLINFSRKNLRSILYNLISNAIKYRSDERSPEVGIKTSSDDGFIKIKVTDNGLGMNSQEKDQIFDMYKRLHTHVEGSGVGLSIVKKIVENSGGRIEVESESGQGSAFSIYLRQ